MPCMKRDLFVSPERIWACCRNAAAPRVIFIRTSVAFRQTSVIYSNRDLFELIHQPTSTKKIPLQHSQARHLAGWTAEGGGGYMAASLRSYSHPKLSSNYCANSNI